MTITSALASLAPSMIPFWIDEYDTSVKSHKECDPAIYLTVIDVAVVSGRDMIIRADHEDPFLRTRHNVPLRERKTETDTRRATEREWDTL